MKRIFFFFILVMPTLQCLKANTKTAQNHTKANDQKHESHEALVKRTINLGLVASIAEFEKQAAIADHPEKEIIKKDLNVLKQMMGKRAKDLQAIAGNLSSKAQAVLASMFANLGILEKIKRANQFLAS